MNLKPGKLYRVTTNFLHARDEQFLGQADHTGLYQLSKGTVFLYIGKYNRSPFVTYSKILLDDKIVVTYNGYLLKKFIEEIDPKNERIPSTDC